MVGRRRGDRLGDPPRRRAGRDDRAAPDHLAPARCDAEIGFWATAAHRGRGVVAEAGRAVIDFAFSDLGLARLGWRAVAGNAPSARTARALGFRYEGMLRQGLTSPRGRDDGWMAGLLASDDRTPAEWPVL